MATRLPFKEKVIHAEQPDSWRRVDQLQVPVWTTDGVTEHRCASAPPIWHEGGEGDTRLGQRRAEPDEQHPGQEAAALGRSVASESLRPH